MFLTKDCFKVRCAPVEFLYHAGMALIPARELRRLEIRPVVIPYTRGK